MVFTTFSHLFLSSRKSYDSIPPTPLIIEPLSRKGWTEEEEAMIDALEHWTFVVGVSKPCRSEDEAAEFLRGEGPRMEMLVFDARMHGKIIATTQSSELEGRNCDGGCCAERVSARGRKRDSQWKSFNGDIRNLFRVISGG
jgi:hypothetical protein